jgi:signal transduction histidine kinase
MEFADILASSIHDIKNSLGSILNTIDALTNDAENHFADPRQVSLLQHETQRANNTLIQLLNLYKLGTAQLTARVTKQHLGDFFEDVIADNQVICQALNLNLDYACAAQLTGYFDADLIHGLLNSAIGNAGRYARSQILLSATQETDYLVIRLEDDGAGFPEPVSQWYTSNNESEVATVPALASDPARTHLGLYFAARIAELHRTPNGRKGYIHLHNGYTLTGGCFELWLP